VPDVTVTYQAVAYDVSNNNVTVARGCTTTSEGAFFTPEPDDLVRVTVNNQYPLPAFGQLLISKGFDHCHQSGGHHLEWDVFGNTIFRMMVFDPTGYNDVDPAVEGNYVMFANDTRYGNGTPYHNSDPNPRLLGYVPDMHYAVGNGGLNHKDPHSWQFSDEAWQQLWLDAGGQTYLDGLTSIDTALAPHNPYAPVFALEMHVWSTTAVSNLWPGSYYVHEVDENHEIWGTEENPTPWYWFISIGYSNRDSETGAAQVVGGRTTYAFVMNGYLSSSQGLITLRKNIECPDADERVTGEYTFKMLDVGDGSYPYERVMLFAPVGDGYSYVGYYERDENGNQVGDRVIDRGHYTVDQNGDRAPGGLIMAEVPGFTGGIADLVDEIKIQRGESVVFYDLHLQDKNIIRLIDGSAPPKPTFVNEGKSKSKYVFEEVIDGYYGYHDTEYYRTAEEIIGYQTKSILTKEVDPETGDEMEIWHEIPDLDHPIYGLIRILDITGIYPRSAPFALSGDEVVEVEALNIYRETSELNLEVLKKTPSADIAAGIFEFDLYKMDALGSIVRDELTGEIIGGLLDTASNQESSRYESKAIFDPITYNKTGTHYYYVVEKQEAKGSAEWIMDQAAWVVIVDVRRIDNELRAFASFVEADEEGNILVDMASGLPLKARSFDPVSKQMPYFTNLRFGNHFPDTGGLRTSALFAAGIVMSAVVSVAYVRSSIYQTHKSRRCS
jgi:hypothetical protein